MRCSNSWALEILPITSPRACPTPRRILSRNGGHWFSITYDPGYWFFHCKRQRHREHRCRCTFCQGIPIWLSYVYRFRNEAAGKHTMNTPRIRKKPFMRLIFVDSGVNASTCGEEICRRNKDGFSSRHIPQYEIDKHQTLFTKSGLSAVNCGFPIDFGFWPLL